MWEDSLLWVLGAAGGKLIELVRWCCPTAARRRATAQREREREEDGWSMV